MKILLLIFATAILSGSSRAEAGNEITLDIVSTREHPRNDIGAFITLKSGRIVSYFPQFYVGPERQPTPGMLNEAIGSTDYSSARLVEIHSDDHGVTWSQPTVFAEKGDNLNLMSVSLLRLASGRLAMFYIIKKSGLDCRPYLRLSTDEGATWSEPKLIIDAPGYFVLNNDRVIQTARGRLIVPVVFNRSLKSVYDPLAPPDTRANDLRGIALWYYSDDEGASWREADTWWAMPFATAAGLQEPGIVELADGSLFSWARTDQGTQYGFRSRDGGLRWTPPEPTELKSPCSPATIKRLPHSSALLAVYNDHSGRFPFVSDENPYRKRTPLVAAISTDGGETWPGRKLLEDDPDQEFTYPAIYFDGDFALIAYNAGAAKGPHLGGMRIRRIALSWFQSGRP